jgi:DNA-directed RNA polymerase specialized sigma24 family protein
MKGTKPKINRNKIILELRLQSGWSLTEIGRHYNLSKQRVSQICQIWAPRLGLQTELENHISQRKLQTLLRMMANEKKEEIERMMRETEKEQRYMNVLYLLRVEKKTHRETAKLTGLHRNTINRISNQEWDKYKHHFGY